MKSPASTAMGSRHAAISCRFGKWSSTSAPLSCCAHTCAVARAGAVAGADACGRGRRLGDLEDEAAVGV
eukprot:1948098-Pleurochrysis_carterae.AAC.4